MSTTTSKPIIPVKKTKFARLSLTHYYTDDKGEKDSASLVWAVRMGYPRIEVYTSNKNSRNSDGAIDYNKMINAPFTPVMFYVFLENFKLAINSDPGDKYIIDHYNSKFEKGVKTNEIVLQAKSVIGKDKEGVIYIAVLDDNKKKVKFDLLPPEDWYKIRDPKTGDIITDKSILSKAYATAYLECVRVSFNGELVEEGMVTNVIENKNDYTKSNYSQPKKETVTVTDSTGMDLDSLI